MSTDDRMETITDPAAIRASDEPDERTTPAPVGAAVALDLDAARAMLNAANTIKATGGAVEIGGVRIEPCDEYGSTVTTARAEAAEAEVVTLRAKVAAVEAKRDEFADLLARALPAVAALARVEALGDSNPDHADTCGSMLTPGAGYPCSCWQADLRAALATTGEGEHVAREVFTAVGIAFVRCSCTNAKSPTSSRWLTEHVPNGGVAELQAVVKRQGEGAKA